MASPKEARFLQKEVSPISAGSEKSNFPRVMSSAPQLISGRLRTKVFVQPQLILGPPSSPYSSCGQKAYLFSQCLAQGWLTVGPFWNEHAGTFSDMLAHAYPGLLFINVFSL